MHDGLRRELAALDLHDKRLTRRVMQVLTKMSERPAGTIPTIFPLAREAKAAYRLLGTQLHSVDPEGNSQQIGLGEALLAACVDACDDIMDKVKQPRGLIRFTSLNELEGRPTQIVRPRMMIYSLTLALLSSLLIFLIVTRSPIGLDCERVVKPGGEMASTTPDGRVCNIFKAHVVNRLAEPVELQIQLADLPGAEVMGAKSLVLASGQVQETQLLVVAPASLSRGIHSFRFVATAADGVKVSSLATFFIP